MAELAFKKALPRVIYFGLMAGALAGLAFYALYRSEGFSPLMALGFGAFIVLAAAAGSQKRMRLFMKDPAQSFAFDDRTIYFDRESLHVDYSRGARSSFPWVCVLRAEWGNDFLLLYLTSTQYVTIPRRVIDGRAEEAIKEALQQARLQMGMGAPPRAMG